MKLSFLFFFYAILKIQNSRSRVNTKKSSKCALSVNFVAYFYKCFSFAYLKLVQVRHIHPIAWITSNGDKWHEFLTWCLTYTRREECKKQAKNIYKTANFSEWRKKINSNDVIWHVENFLILHFLARLIRATMGQTKKAKKRVRNRGEKRIHPRLQRKYIRHIMSANKRGGKSKKKNEQRGSGGWATEPTNLKWCHT